MENTYAPRAAALPPAPGPVRARFLHPERALNPELDEVLQFHAGPEVYGLLILPRDAAYDVISRLQEAPTGLPIGQRQAAGHVRYVLQLDYRNEADAPPEWIMNLIELIRSVNEEERRRLGRIYAAYVVAVAIGTGPGGLEALQHWHERLPPDEPATDATLGEPDPTQGG